MRRFFTKKSVAILFTAFMLFGFFNTHVTYAVEIKCPNVPYSTPEGTKAYNKYYYLIENTPTNKAVVITPEESCLMTNEQRDTLLELNDKRIANIKKDSSLISIGKSLLDNISPLGIASAILIWLFEMVMLPIGAMLLGIAGKIINYSIEYTIFGGGFVIMKDSITTVWVLLRDVINISFIFILLYTAIKQIITSETSQRILKSVIIASVLVNFSLFITRVVIDAGNIAATAIYNQIEKEGGGGGGNFFSSIAGNAAESAKSLMSGSKSSVVLSDKLMSSLQIKMMWEDDELKVGTSAIIYAFIKLLLILVALFTFVFMSILLIGRFVILVFLMATSPIGFVGDVIPKLSETAKKWRSTLQDQILIAPTFMFFMLLTIKVGNQLSQNSSKDMMIMFFNYFIIIFLLIQSVKVTKSMSGEIGKFADKIAAGATGLALAGATAPAAFLGRNTFGKKATEILNSKTGADIKARADSGSLIAKAQYAALNKTAKSTFDVRDAKIGKDTVGKMVGNVGELNLAGDNAKGSGRYGKYGTGYAGQWEKQKAETTEGRIKRDKEVSEMEQKFVDENVVEKLRKKEIELEKKAEVETNTQKKAQLEQQKNQFKQERTKAQENPNGVLNKLSTAHVNFSASEQKLEKIKKDQENLKNKINGGGLTPAEMQQAVNDLAQAEQDLLNTEIDYETYKILTEAQTEITKPDLKTKELGNKNSTGSMLEVLNKMRDHRNRAGQGVRKRLLGDKKGKEEIARITEKEKSEKEKENLQKAKDTADLAKELGKIMKENES